MSLEPFTSFLALRHERLLRDPEGTQRTVLARLLPRVKGSAVANALGLRGDESFAEFLQVPSQPYSFYAPFVQQVLHGDHYAFGNDPIVALGETSGSQGAPKLIPHTNDSLGSIKRFAERVLLYQLREGKHYIPHFTKWLAVTASTRVRREGGIPIGFISGLMYDIARKKRGNSVLPSPAVAAVADWDERIEQAVAEAWDKKIGTLLGVPAYLMRFLEAAATNANGIPLGSVWPMLGRICYSGTSIAPYQAQMEQMIGRPLVTRSLYTATEGSFAAELDDRDSGDMELMVDLAVFAFRDIDHPRSTPVAAWEVMRGRRYEVLVTTLAGLIQYEIGDVLEVTETRPLRVRVVGRTTEEINIATEKLSVPQALATIDKVARHAALHRDHFVVTPDPTNPKRHVWIVECCESASEVEIARLIDEALASVNPSYAALRQGNSMLHHPRVIVAGPKGFDSYICAGFGRHGQFKFRHLFTDARTLARAPGLEGFAASLGVA